VNPTLLGLLLAGAPIVYDAFKSRRRSKAKGKRAKKSRRRNR